MPGPPGLVRRRVDQRPPDALPPRARLDEQAVKLGEAVVALDDRKAGNLTVDLRHRHLAALDDRERKRDRVGMGLEMRPVFGIGERGTPLEVLQSLPFRRSRRPEPDLSAL